MCYNSNSNKDKDVVRVKKGMVFWWDSNPEIYKENVPRKEVLGKSYPDRRMYGRRPWVVISGNENNKGYLTFTVCPLSSKAEIEAPYHLEVDMFDGKSVICIEQMLFVNEYELVEYYCMFSDSVIKKIDDKISRYFGISNQSWSGIGIKDALDRIEAVISGMVNEKVEESKKVTEGDVEYIVQNVLNKLENKKDVVNNKVNNEVVLAKTVVPGVDMDNPQIKKFYHKYPNYVPLQTKQKQNPIVSVVKRDWTVEKINEFISDCSVMSKKMVMEKWGLASEKAVYSMKYFVKKKLEKLSGK